MRMRWWNERLPRSRADTALLSIFTSTRSNCNHQLCNFPLFCCKTMSSASMISKHDFRKGKRREMGRWSGFFFLRTKCPKIYGGGCDVFKQEVILQFPSFLSTTVHQVQQQQQRANSANSTQTEVNMIRIKSARCDENYFWIWKWFSPSWKTSEYNVLVRMIVCSRSMQTWLPLESGHRRAPTHPSTWTIISNTICRKFTPFNTPFPVGFPPDVLVLSSFLTMNHSKLLSSYNLPFSGCWGAIC